MHLALKKPLQNLLPGLMYDTLKAHFNKTLNTKLKQAFESKLKKDLAIVV